MFAKLRVYFGERAQPKTRRSHRASTSILRVDRGLTPSSGLWTCLSFVLSLRESTKQVISPGFELLHPCTGQLMRFLMGAFPKNWGATNPHANFKETDARGMLQLAKTKVGAMPDSVPARSQTPLHVSDWARRHDAQYSLQAPRITQTAGQVSRSSLETQESSCQHNTIL